jgi:hypothetical protein
MQFPPFAKAIVAAVLTGAAPSVAAATSTAGVTTTSTVESVAAAVLGYLATYWVPNGKSPKANALGFVVTLKTDADTFLATVLEGLPGLVKSAMQAALKPAAPVADVPAPADPAAPVDQSATVEPAILGKA